MCYRLRWSRDTQIPGYSGISLSVGEVGRNFSSRAEFRPTGLFTSDTIIRQKGEFVISPISSAFSEHDVEKSYVVVDLWWTNDPVWKNYFHLHDGRIFFQVSPDDGETWGNFQEYHD
jgi:hypothetical protein